MTTRCPFGMVYCQFEQPVKEKWWQGIDIILVHRVGRLEVGKISVYISVRAAHRDTAYAASRYIIKELKKCVCIWKKEYY